MEMRCDHKLHGVVDGDIIEVKCGSSLCGKRPGTVVIHRFSSATGKLLETKLYKDTPNINKERNHGR